MSTDEMDAEVPCCDYRDHGYGWCACTDHTPSKLHPFGHLLAEHEDVE